MKSSFEVAQAVTYCPNSGLTTTLQAEGLLPYASFRHFLNDDYFASVDRQNSGANSLAWDFCPSGTGIKCACSACLLYT